jgi:L-ascorbate metabolism protein UlaG (beta-lactamase superfamily)
MNRNGMKRKKTNEEPSASGAPDRRRRLLVGLAALAGAASVVPRSAWAQTGDLSGFERTLRSVRLWWNRLNSEPDEGDREASDSTRYVAPAAPRPLTWSDGDVSLAWIGHSTFLINFAGTIILTDPVFSEKVGISLLGMGTIGLRRFVPPALGFDAIPRPDLVLVSHAHMDHYDIPSLKRLPRDVPIIMARDTREFVKGVGFSQLTELDWGETAAAGGVHIEATPARHWGRRYPWDRDRGYNGFLLTKHGRTILFGGDTAYTDGLAGALRGRSVEVALLPIGGYNPYIYSHASPEQAWTMFHEVGARYLAPMHWRTFRLSHERPFEPYERLSTAVNGSRQKIAIHAVGDTWTLPS